MDLVKISKCRNEFEKLLKKPLYAYPFYDKTDEELIDYAINNNQTDFEFGLFELGERYIKTLQFSDELKEINYLPLVRLNKGNDQKTIEIKLSSFIFSSIRFTPFLYEANTIQSTIDNKRYYDYNNLFEKLDKHKGDSVLITKCWTGLTKKFAGITTCVNIVPINDNSNIANVIRYYFKKERIDFINDLLCTPIKYVLTGENDEYIAYKVLEEYKNKLETELDKLKNIKIEINEKDSSIRQKLSQYELNNVVDPSTFEILKDIDSNEYKAIKIGDQVWMVENLRTTRYRNGEIIPNITDINDWSNLETGALCNFNNNIVDGKKYGKLYNWFAVNDKRNIAPIGWHVPSNEEWDILKKYLLDILGTSGSLGKSLASKTDWTYSERKGDTGNELETNNESGFNALPSGARFRNGRFYGEQNDYTRDRCYWWSSSEYPDSEYHAWAIRLLYEDNHLGRYLNYKSCGFSVRCIKD